LVRPRKAGAELVPEVSGFEDLPIPYFGAKPLATSKAGMAICSNPWATRAAVNVLKAGGNACDAALAAAVTQAVVEPHMTTITGMLSMLYYDAGSGKTTYMNGCMNAPLVELKGFNALDLEGGRGAGVPGFWAGFEAALAKHGSRPKAELVRPAIDFARNGFPIYPFLYGEMFSQLDVIGRNAEGRALYMPNGSLLPPGAILKQPGLAGVLERLVAEGNRYFYQGEFAARYSEVVKGAGGVITPEDFARYEVRWDEPARSTYRGYQVVGSPPPDNGGTHVIEALNILEQLDLPKWGPAFQSADTLYWMTRIYNEVMTEGAKQTDPRSHPIPLDLIVSKDFATTRLKLMKMATTTSSASPTPPPGSNHLTVADGKGNVATILHSVMALPWSNGLFVDGVSIAASGGHFFRVMPKPGDRATAYVAPNIIFKNGKPVLASGSPSVGLIPNVLQNTVNILDFNIPIEESVKRPRYGGASVTPTHSGQNYIEVDLDEKIRTEVSKRGPKYHVVSPWHFMNGSFEGIHLTEGGLMRASADPRRCGMAEGV
jgi:gamma-glutamyltranspeptidase/glutathione hydrolase